MNISFLDFWPDFDSRNNFFIHIINQIKTNVNITRPELADVIIYSCFGNDHKKYNCKKIFFTGENIRPNFNDCNYSLSFDFSEYDGKNIRIPLWYLYIDWFEVKSYRNPEWLIPLSYLDKQNEFTLKNKSKFCSSVFSKHNEFRKKAVNTISEYIDVDCYGKIHKNSLPEGEKNKMDVISSYRFSICFENSIYPGYFTEKILHAKIAGCIPIYYSDKTFEVDFNKNCCINLIDFENFDHLLEEIKRVDSDPQIYNKKINEPLFSIPPTLDKIKNKLDKIL